MTASVSGQIRVGMSAKQTKILISDDQVALVDGLEMLLTRCGFSVVGKVYDAEEVEEAYFRINPDVLICDVMFDQKKGALNGLDVLKMIKAKDAEAKVIMYSQFDSGEYMNESYKLGAASYLTKNFDQDDLIQAIESASKGEVYFTKNVAVKMASLSVKQQIEEKSPRDVLSGRLYDVYILTAQGRTQAEIALEMDMHHRTITKDIREVKKLLGIQNPAELTALAIKFGLIDIENIKIGG